MHQEAQEEYPLGNNTSVATIEETIEANNAPKGEDVRMAGLRIQE